MSTSSGNEKDTGKERIVANEKREDKEQEIPMGHEGVEVRELVTTNAGNGLESRLFLIWTLYCDKYGTRQLIDIFSKVHTQILATSCSTH